MITNEKQYKISKRKLSGILEKIDAFKKTKDIKDLKNQLLLGSLEDIEQQLKKEVQDYETLKHTKSSKLKERQFSELPNLLIEYKISNNLTHKELSKKLGIKEQQLQRYESQGFKTVSFQNLVKFLDLMKLNLTIKTTSLKKRKAKKSTLQP